MMLNYISLFLIYVKKKDVELSKSFKIFALKKTKILSANYLNNCFYIDFSKIYH